MISFAPLLPWPALYALGALAALATLPALILQASGAWLRLAGFTFLLITLAGPDWVTNTTKPVPSIVLLLTDHSQSMQLGNRAALAAQAASTLRTSAGAIDLRTIDIPPAEAGGTSLFAALQSALATIPTTQLAGIIAITDGEISDPPPAALPAPFTALLTARAEETDRELRLTNPPAYGLAGQTVPLTLTVLDHGASDTGQPAAVTITEDGIPIPTPPFIIGQAQTIPLPIPHAGPIIITATAALLPGEVSPLNNTTAFTLTGIRKRLNVLLISGHPSPAERTWRVLLKSDPAIRLIHFTILRLPDETLDAAPQDIALVPFPVEQLFNTDINKFDLIILDDFSAGGLLPPEDLENITNFVTNGGALLTEAGPEFESPDSLANSPLGPVVPATPLPDGTITQAFSPAHHPPPAPATPSPPPSQAPLWPPGPACKPPPQPPALCS